MEYQEVTRLFEILINHYKKKSEAKVSVFTTKNRNYEEYIEKYEKYFENNNSLIKNDIYLAFDESRNNFKSISSTDLYVVFDDHQNDSKFIHLVVDLHLFFRLFKMKHYVEKQLTSINDVIKYNDKNSVKWFRGQINAEWQLIPSFFRNAKESFLWTWNDIYNDYQYKPKKVSLIKKLNEVDIDTIANPYKTIAFIQHAIGYSQLIDFTRSPQVALSFALSNGAQMGSYYKDDACVYVLDVTNYKILKDFDEIDDVVKKAKVQVFKRNESIINIITNEFWLSMLNDEIKSIIHLINKPTNDRMIFQKGTFILYDNVVIIGNEIYMSFNKVSFIGSQLTKYIIDAKDKEKLYEELMINHPQYHQRYLLDPYLYLGEPDK